MGKCVFHILTRDKCHSSENTDLELENSPEEQRPHPSQVSPALPPTDRHILGSEKGQMIF